jgi:hypothetical protein
MNSTPESMSVAMKARLRESRSSLAMTSFALFRLQAAKAFTSSGRWLRLPLSTSVNSPISDQVPRRADQVTNGRFLPQSRIAFRALGEHVTAP